MDDEPTLFGTWPLSLVRQIAKSSARVPSDTELLFDYGDRDPATLEQHPWLAT